MDNFSYKDAIRAAFASCIPCLGRRTPAESNDNAHSDARTHRSLSSELEGLLRDTETEAETHSMHSNIGVAGRRKHRERPAFSLTLFGYTLFGRQPIYLSDDEDERGWRRPVGTVSSSTLDSDAAPLDASAIARLSSPDRAGVEQQRREEEARRKGERKARRKERRERERLSTLRSLDASSLAEGGDFEGFQGSGESSLPPLSADQFGPFVSGPELLLTGDPGDNSGDADDADLGGGLYTRKQRTHTLRSGSGSDSRSQTSASMSNGDPNLHYSQHQLTQVASPPYAQTEMQMPKPAKAKKQRTSKRLSPLSSSTASQSTAPYTPTQSASASPAVAAFPIPRERMEHAVEERDARGFPSVGLSGARGKARDMGAFLASREAAQP